MTDRNCDLAVVGAGPGGYVAAICAAQQGLKVILIEGRELGGVCLQAGCIPTKSVLSSVGLLRRTRAASALGLEVTTVEASLSTITSRWRKVVQQLTQGIGYLLSRNQVEVIRGRAFLRSQTEIEICDSQSQVLQTIRNSGAVVLATGSRPVSLPGIEFDHCLVLDSCDVLNLAELPGELLIVGGGYVGCEFATVYSSLGSKVTVLEQYDRLLPEMDKELGQTLERSFKRAGIRVMLNVPVAKAQTDNGVRFELANGQTIAGDKALIAVGRSPNLEGLGLENAGVQTKGRYIEVNDYLQTSVPNIYAIGDVTGKKALAHVASAQARFVVENIIRRRAGTGSEQSRAGGDGGIQAMNYDAIPACVFTHPEIASVGLSDEEAAKRGYAARVSRFPFAASGRAQAAAEPDGFVKLVADAQNGRLLGGHIAGEHASELIATVSLAIQHGLTAQQLASTVLAHPTLSEAIVEAAEGVFGQPTHFYAKR